MTSKRKTFVADTAREKRIKPEQVAESFVGSDDRDGFSLCYINSFIGCGVFANEAFANGSFMLEYRGELITKEEGDRRMDNTHIAEGSFLFFFSRGNKEFCFDASHSKGLGRMINHSRRPNCRMKKLIVNGNVHLCVFAIKDISPGEQITYDYGITDKELPWLKADYPLQQFEKPDGVPVYENSLQQVRFCANCFARLCEAEKARHRYHFSDSDDDGINNVKFCLNPILTKLGHMVVHTVRKQEADDEVTWSKVKSESLLKSSQITDSENDQSTQILKPISESPVVAQTGQPDAEESELRQTDTGQYDNRQSDTSQCDTEQYISQSESLHCVPKSSQITDSENGQSTQILKPISESPVVAQTGQPDAEESEIRQTDTGQYDNRQSDTSQCDTEQYISQDGLASETDSCSDLYSESGSDWSKDTCKDYVSDTSSDSNDSNEAPESILPISVERIYSNRVAETSHPIRASNITVCISQNSEKRKWDKKDNCPFCQKAFSKLPRHMGSVHSSEIDIAAALSYPKYSKERKEKFQELRSRGNYSHNIDVIKKGEGQIIPFRRPSVNTEHSSYVPCSECLAFFKKDIMWKHKKCCPKSKAFDSGTGKRPYSHQKASSALLPVCNTVSELFRTKILDSMAHDMVSFVVRQDRLIVDFGIHLFAKNGQEVHQHQYIKQKLREVGRLLLKVRELNSSLQTLEECIDPRKFMLIVTAVRDIAGFDQNTAKYKIPSLAIKLGHSLKKCALYMKSGALQSNDLTKKQRADEFLQLCEVKWSPQISCQAFATLNDMTYNKPKRIPLAQDIKTLNCYLSDNACTLIKNLAENPDETTWRVLAEVTLTQITLFNRRRSGEMERLSKERYEQGIICSSESQAQEEILSSLSPLEAELVKTLSRIEIRGKKGRKVAVLLTDKHKQQINLLNEKRAIGGIIATNPFLFPRPGNSKTPLRSSDTLRKFSTQCNAKKPELLTSTCLRKHIAVITQLLNLKNNELDIVARFMGHDINIHRDYYRLPDDVLELAKVGKILINLEMGKLQHWKGKTLDDIEITTEEALSDIADQSDSPNDSDNSVDPDDSDNPGDAGDPVEHSNEGFRKKPCIRVPWSEAEMAAVNKELGYFIRLQKVPGKRHCEVAKTNESALQNRSWMQIKFCVKNIITKNRVRLATLQD